MGLKMNITKTKVMVVDNTPINVNNVLIENVPGYVYLGQHYSLKEKNQDKEIQRRIMAGWAAYAKHRDIFQKQPCHLPEKTSVGETGVHWDTGSIGTPPLVENLQHTEPMRCHFMDAWEPPLYKSIRTKKIMQYKKVGE